MSETIRVGIIGAGANSRRHHIPGLQAIDGVEVTVVANRTRESGRRVADEFGIPRVADSWDQVVRDSEIDAVVIGTWPYVHGAMTVAALENGKHVLCEARMASDSRTAREMHRASLAHPGQILQIVPAPETLRIDPIVTRVTNSIRSLPIADGEMTQQELADRVGSTGQTIHAIEQARHSPSFEAASEIARVLNRPHDEVFAYNIE